MKKNLSALFMVMVMAVSAAGCSTASKPEKENTNAKNDSVSVSTEAKEYKIGISQFAEHASLDNCKAGFLEGLAQEGIVDGENLTVFYENAQADTGTAGQIADNFVSKGVDMICAIATPSAASAYNAAMKANIPVIYTAVTDPLLAGLAKEDGTPVGEVTGTSNRLPVEAQLQMIRKILPDAKTIGIIYTTSEPNSMSSLRVYEEMVEKYGFSLEAVGISSPADLPLAADNIVRKVDCLTNLTDNTVVQGLTTVLAKAEVAGIPVFGSEEEQVKNGCLASMGLDYVGLGIQTGKIAAKVLKGEAKASDISFETIAESQFHINTAVADNLGITLDSEYVSTAKGIFESIAE